MFEFLDGLTIREMLMIKLDRDHSSLTRLSDEMGFANYLTFKSRLDCKVPYTLDEAAFLAGYLGISLDDFKRIVDAQKQREKVA